MPSFKRLAFVLFLLLVGVCWALPTLSRCIELAKRDSAPLLAASPSRVPSATLATNGADGFLLPGSAASSGNGTANGGKIAISAGFSHALFSDFFSQQPAGTQPNPDKWTVDLGTGYFNGPTNWGTQEVQTYTSSTNNLVITGTSGLRITPIRTSDSWTSARIKMTAKHDFACAPGKKIRMEALIRLAPTSPTTAMGIWPAFWSLDSAYRASPLTLWPGVGEIDIMEVTNGLSTVQQTAHCGVAPGEPCHEKTGLGSSSEFARGNWVVFAAEVDRTNPGGGFSAENIVWSVDWKVTKRSLAGRSAPRRPGHPWRGRRECCC